MDQAICFGKTKSQNILNKSGFARRNFSEVGDTGFEPATSWSQTMHASQLRQSPLFLKSPFSREMVRPLANQRVSHVPLAGIEPTRFLRAQDFKSCVYTSFTTAAKCNQYYSKKKPML